MANAPTLINLPPPPSEPVTPSEVPSRSGTPNSTTTSISELSTVAIKDGHRGHLPHHQHQYHPSGLVNQLDAERADRISRLAGLERVTTARNPPPLGANLTPGIAAPPVQATSYFDANGTPVMGRERSTVGSASATGSVGARTTWAGSEAGDADKMSESQDMEMDTSSVGGLSEEGGSLVGFGEGARTPARQSMISSPGGQKVTTPTPREAKMVDGMTYDRDVIDTTMAEAQRRSLQQVPIDPAERVAHDNINTTSADRMRQSNKAPGGPTYGT